MIALLLVAGAFAGPEFYPSTANPPEGSISLSELANLAEDTIIGRTSSGAGVPEAVTFTDLAQVLTACTDVACIRTATGQSWVLNSATHSTSSTTPTAIPGCSFTPTAGKLHRFTVETSHTSAATTTGLVLEIQPGNVVSGSAHLEMQGGTSAAQAVNRGPFPGSVSATGGTTTGVGETSSRAMGLFLADPTSPTAFAVYAGSEVGASQVDVTKCVLSWVVLD